MFVIVYDLADMPPNCQTFLRQRTVYMPIQQHNQFHSSYVISNSTQSTSLHNNSTCSFHKPQYHSTHTNTNHLNCNSTPSTSMINTNVSMNNTLSNCKLYLHTDLRLIFSRDKFEFDPRIATYELRSFVDAPSNPRYSPKKWSTRHQNITKYQKSIHHSKIT
ncbi:unnamed protein product [Schistosoma curassoni]|uniref:Chromosome_seg domain-containing protein n=1 Tax=Schistosoma curassoni TaxID=6186 RepID=A0A183K5T3_9TREM|nr:unnamed protein product [Schistosoma curassoni]